MINHTHSWGSISETYTQIDMFCFECWQPRCQCLSGILKNPQAGSANEKPHLAPDAQYEDVGEMISHKTRHPAPDDSPYENTTDGGTGYASASGRGGESSYEGLGDRPVERPAVYDTVGQAWSVHIWTESYFEWMEILGRNVNRFLYNINEHSITEKGLPYNYVLCNNACNAYLFNLTSLKIIWYQ